MFPKPDKTVTEPILIAVFSAGFMRMHFLTSIAFVLFLSGAAMHPDLNARMLMMVPSLIMFYATLVLFGMEYEKDRSLFWKKKEKKLVEETYLRFFSEENHKN